MDESSRLIDIVVFCIAGFIVPVFYCLFLVGGVENTTVQVKVQSFAENVSTKGYVDYAMYESFVEELNSVGVLVSPEFHVEHELLAPEYKMRSIEDSEEYLDGLWSGSNVLNQGTITIQRPSVTDPGEIPEGGLTGNVAGANTSTTGPSASHTHSGACYTGTQHIHDASCPSRSVRCSAGCVKHTHTGNSSSGTGCYRGSYTPGTSEFCGAWGVSSWGSETSITCPWCGGGAIEYSFSIVCSGCGATGGAGGLYCSNCTGPINLGLHYITSGGYYDRNCGKSSSTYYKGNTKCSACNGTGYVNSVACTKTNGGYYNADGSVCTPLCNQIVTSLTPVTKEQVVVAGGEVDLRVKATFSDGSSAIVTGTLSGFNPTAYNVVQTVTISYGSYAGSLSNPNKTECTLKVMVRYPTKICENGHLYYLVTGDTTLCPYCKAYPENLTVLGVVEEPFHTIKGTSLQQNGISIKVTYYDGRVEILTSGWQDDFDMNYIGEQTVTITYLGAVTTLQVYNDRIKVPCSVCGYEYALYPDNTDPGCPKCLSAIPVFTGNVLRYKESVSYGEILDELYHGDGICYFSIGDRVEFQIWKTEKTPTNSVFRRIFGSGIGEELISMYSVKIRDEKVRK